MKGVVCWPSKWKKFGEGALTTVFVRAPAVFCLERSRSLPLITWSVSCKLLPNGPKSVVVQNYDRQHYGSLGETARSVTHTAEVHPIPIPVPAVDSGHLIVEIPQSSASPRSPRSPLAHLPRSHQMVIEKTSPPLGRKAISSPCRPPDFGSMDLEEAAPAPRSAPPREQLETGKGMYPANHRQARSFMEPVMMSQEEFRQRERQLYERQHRFAFSYTSQVPPEHLLHAGPPTEFDFPDTRPLMVELPPEPPPPPPAPPGYEDLASWGKFYRQMQSVFDPNRRDSIGVTSGSSSSGSSLIQPHLYAMSPSKYNGNIRQAKSLEDPSASSNYRLHPPDSHRQSRSFDSHCAACQNDALQYVNLQEPKDGLLRRTSTYQPTLIRQQTLDESDIDQMEDSINEQIMNECRRLWSLRGTLEETTEGRYVDEEEDREVQRMEAPMMDQEMDLDANSYTTSFESNTEPIPMDEALNSRKPSGPFLELPKLSLEAKRQKYKNLFARRQWELQKDQMGSLEGNSLEESFETNCSSESSRQGQINITSVESNTGGEQTDSTVDSQGRKKIAEIKKDSGYKSQSTETHQQQHMQGPAIPSSHLTVDTITQCPSVDSQLDRRMDPVTDFDPFRKSLRRHGSNPVYPQFYLNENSNSDSRSDQGSFDDGAPPPPPAPCRLPPLPPNVHLARMRRSYESVRSPLSRDYSIDSRSDFIYREFVQFDPRLELVGKLRPRAVRSHPVSRHTSAEEQWRPRFAKFSSEDSIEEEHPPFYNPPPLARHQIPVIRLPDDKELSVG